jgi:hypothetical protein
MLLCYMQGLIARGRSMSYCCLNKFKLRSNQKYDHRATITNIFFIYLGTHNICDRVVLVIK